MHGRSVQRIASNIIEAEKRRSCRETNRYSGTAEVYLPKFYFWTGLVCGSINLSVVLLIFFLSDEILRFLVSGCFCLWVLVCAFLMWVSKIWSIIVCQDDGFFYYTTVFNRIYKINFEECEVVSHTQIRIVLKAMDKNFYVDPHAINIDILLHNLNKKK